MKARAVVAIAVTAVAVVARVAAVVPKTAAKAVGNRAKLPIRTTAVHITFFRKLKLG